MAATIRVGKISSIDYKTGQARVVYKDRDNSVTVSIPVICSEDTGLLREEDSVLVVHLSNGTASGIILGRYHAGSNPPEEGDKDIYFKCFSREKEAYLKYDKEKQELKIVAPHFVVETEEETFAIIPMLIDHENRIKTLESKVEILEKKVAELKKVTEDHEQRLLAGGL